jgi:hypothetical protein
MPTFKFVQSEPVSSVTEIKRLTGRFQLFKADIKQFKLKHVIFIFFGLFYDAINFSAYMYITSNARLSATGR